jgi:hypothetical protein
MTQAVAWTCTRKLDGDKRVFDEPFFASNPAYVKAHPAYDWTPLYVMPDSILPRLQEAEEVIRAALKVLDEFGVDAAHTELANARQMYSERYKPHRITAAENDLAAVESTLARARSYASKYMKESDSE